MKKTVFMLMLIFAVSVLPASAAGRSYTFNKLNIVTDGSPNDVENARLTNDITVTTSGNMNRKYAAVTDLAHNKDAGTFPVNDTFKAEGYYIYLGTANANDGSVITLNMPEIKAGSKVELTFAKPVVTNNGSTVRNSNDPYAYFKIADRYISINGDNFDTWRTESVVTGEDTDAIDFYCDKWGAVCISKIEVSDGDKTPLHSLNIKSTQYANLTVNGIKFCADENGELTVPSLPENEAVTITAEKDGYKNADTQAVIGSTDTEINIPLECEINAAYYESDFGNSEGILELNGKFSFAEPIKTDAEVVRIFSRLTFAKNGRFGINTGSGAAPELTYRQDGIYAGDVFITSKDNMEFELFFDRKNKLVFLRQNEKDSIIDGAEYEIGDITALSGENVSIEYFGVSYPDTKKLVIEGEDKIAAPINDGSTLPHSYTAVPEYQFPNSKAEFKVEGDAAEYVGLGLPCTEFIKAKPLSQGKVIITAEYNGAAASKEVEVVTASRVAEYSAPNTQYINLYDFGWLIFNPYQNHAPFRSMLNDRTQKIDSVTDENGITLLYGDTYEIRDCTSSDESVLKIDDEGNFIAVGKGKTTVRFNIYTGGDNIFEREVIVGNYYKNGIAEADTFYVENDFNDKHITGFRVLCQDGGSKEAALSQIPAYTVEKKGTVIRAYYNEYNKLTGIRSEPVNKGDKIFPSNGKKKVYFINDNAIQEITETDTTASGFEISSVPFGEYYEIAPVYTYTDIGDVSEGITLDGEFPGVLYDLTFKKGEPKRGDIYVNGYMAGNNVDQCDTDRKLEAGSEYTVNKFNIGNSGKITVSMTDGSTLLDSVTVTMSDMSKKPDIYIIGDSLVCNYYGDFDREVGGGRTGWGQVIGNYINANIVNLANSGQFAKGLYETAFPSVIQNKPDYCFIECGYNDRSYSTRDEMIECVKDMIKQCRDNYITPVLVTPNASQHDYKPSVVWSGYLRDIAVDTGCPIIDLSKESYDFLYSLYGDNEDGVVAKNYNLTEVGGDTLHSSHAAAYKWASIVAQDFKAILSQELEDMSLAPDRINEWFNTDFEYTFTDTEGNEITAKVE